MQTRPATTPCSDCGKPVEAIDMFPKGRCLDCHAKAWDAGEIERPTAEQLADQFKKAVKF